MEALVVDDHPLFRDAVCRLVERVPEFDGVVEAGSFDEALDIVNARPIGLALVDVVLPAGGGVALTQKIKQVRPACRVLGLSVHDDVNHVAAMMRAGATGYAFKTQGADAIVDAIRSVLRDDRYVPPTLDAAQLASMVEAREASPLDRLTTRERQVYGMLVSGASNESVAEALRIARRTVETHRQNIMRKLEVSSIAQLVLLSYRLHA